MAHVKRDILGASAERPLVDPILGAVSPIILAAEQRQRIARGIGAEGVRVIGVMGFRAESFIGEKKALACRQAVTPVEMVLVIAVQVDSQEEPAAIGGIQRIAGDSRDRCG